MEAETKLQLVIICSASGAGKTTLARRLVEDESLGLHFSVSHTTRPPRATERDGHDYHFVDEQAFARIRDGDRFAEHATVHGNLYGTSLDELDRIGAVQGARGIVFDIDVQGARQLVERFADALTVFILPPSIAELRARLEGRGTESEADLETRLRNAVGELRQAAGFDYLVVNDDLELACSQLRAVVLAHRQGRAFMAARAEALVSEWESGER